MFVAVTRINLIKQIVFSAFSVMRLSESAQSTCALCVLTRYERFLLDQELRQVPGNNDLWTMILCIDTRKRRWINQSNKYELLHYK